MTDSNTPSRVVLTVRQFAARHPAFTEAALRNYIFYATPRRSSKGAIPSNGLETALIRLGRKVLIDEGRFFTWLDAGGSAGAGSRTVRRP